VREHGPVTYSVPAVTTGGKLPCSYVIHAVGPVWGEGDEDNKLRAAITGSLRVADQMELTTIAFPAISTGIFGFPKERAARVILSAIQEYLLGDTVSHILVVRMTLFDKPTIDAFLTAWKEMGLREME
jgi:O-acetyl-ADP-ribose deacetylase (regulator of RNase III)